jgi:pyruvate kinase
MSKEFVRVTTYSRHATFKMMTLNGNRYNSSTTTSTVKNNSLVVAAAEAANALRLDLPKISDVGCRTKVVCTIGPATDTPERIQQLVHNGMSVARLNFSHVANSGTATDYYAYPKHCRDLIRNATGLHSQLTKLHPLEPGTIQNEVVPNLRAVLVDTKGPEIRTKGPLPGNVPVLEITTGDIVELHVDIATTNLASDNNINNNTDTDKVIQLLIDYENIAKTVIPGGQVLLDDGLIALHVIECFPEKGYVSCVALNSGPIKVNKGVNLPGVSSLDLPALTLQDCKDLQWAVEHDADYVAASFIRTPDHVRSVKAYLERCLEMKRSKLISNNQNEVASLLLRPLIISKIESKEGVDNFHEILRESDGIMVARGDVCVPLFVFVFIHVMIHFFI